MCQIEFEKIGDVCDFIGGSQPPKSTFIYDLDGLNEDDYVRLIQIRDYKSDKHIVYIQKDKTKKFCSEGDVMIGRYGPPVFQILKGLKGAYNVALMKAIPDESILDKEYLFKFLQSPNIQKYVIDLSERAAGQSGVNKPALHDYPIYLPALETQKLIVAKLDHAFTDIEKAKANAEQNLKNARELFESYLQKVYTDSNYNESKLGELVDVLTDYHANGSYKVLKQHVDLKESEDFAWMVRSTDFEKKFKNEKRYINESAYKYLKKTPIYGGEIIMSKIGNAGKVYLMPEITRPCSLAMNLFLIRLNEKLVNNEYVFRYLNSKSGKAQIAPLLNGVATQTITKDSVRSLNIPLPSLKEQSEVISKLNLLEEKIVSLENIYRNKISAINELKQSILQKAFNGELA